MSAYPRAYQEVRLVDIFAWTVYVDDNRPLLCRSFCCFMFTS